MLDYSWSINAQPDIINILWLAKIGLQKYVEGALQEQAETKRVNQEQQADGEEPAAED